MQEPTPEELDAKRRIEAIIESVPQEKRPILRMQFENKNTDPKDFLENAIKFLTEKKERDDEHYRALADAKDLLANSCSNNNEYDAEKKLRAEATDLLNNVKDKKLEEYSRLINALVERNEPNKAIALLRSMIEKSIEIGDPCSRNIFNACNSIKDLFRPQNIQRDLLEFITSITFAPTLHSAAPQINTLHQIYNAFPSSPDHGSIHSTTHAGMLLYIQTVKLAQSLIKKDFIKDATFTKAMNAFDFEAQFKSIQNQFTSLQSLVEHNSLAVALANKVLAQEKEIATLHARLVVLEGNNNTTANNANLFIFPPPKLPASSPIDKAVAEANIYSA